jgi:hypothetical protein
LVKLVVKFGRRAAWPVCSFTERSQVINGSTRMDEPGHAEGEQNTHSCSEIGVPHVG